MVVRRSCRRHGRLLTDRLKTFEPPCLSHTGRRGCDMRPMGQPIGCIMAFFSHDSRRVNIFPLNMTEIGRSASALYITASALRIAASAMLRAHAGHTQHITALCRHAIIPWTFAVPFGCRPQIRTLFSRTLTALTDTDP
jgi:hypothetical protein